MNINYKKAREAFTDESFVDECENALNMDKEDEELQRRYPDDIKRSVRVLPLEKDGKRYLRMVATDEKKTEDLHLFLKEGKFTLEREFVEGVDRESVKKEIEKRVKEKFKK